MMLLDLLKEPRYIPYFRETACSASVPTCTNHDFHVVHIHARNWKERQNLDQQHSRRTKHSHTHGDVGLHFCERPSPPRKLPDSVRAVHVDGLRAGRLAKSVVKPVRRRVQLEAATTTKLGGGGRVRREAREEGEGAHRVEGGDSQMGRRSRRSMTTREGRLRSIFHCVLGWWR